MPSKLDNNFHYSKVPNFIIIDFVPINHPKKEFFTYNESLEIKQTKSNYKLIGMINMPSPNHFTCSIYEPNTLCSINVKGSLFIHDGLKNQGKLVQITRKTQL